jgi:hypothetical protein
MTEGAHPLLEVAYGCDRCDAARTGSFGRQKGADTSSSLRRSVQEGARAVAVRGHQPPPLAVQQGVPSRDDESRCPRSVASQGTTSRTTGARASHGTSGDAGRSLTTSCIWTSLRSYTGGVRALRTTRRLPNSSSAQTRFAVGVGQEQPVCGAVSRADDHACAPRIRAARWLSR